MYKIGIDLGGTKTEGILLDDSLNVIQRTRISTPQNNYPEIINQITFLVDGLSKSIKDFTVGVCTPGAISKKTGFLKNSNTQCLIGKPLKHDLEKKLDKKISMENDANLVKFIMAEQTLQENGVIILYTKRGTNAIVVNKAALKPTSVGLH